jgi:hypothetical protein
MADSPWQRLTKPRRAAVYRAIGRAARDAREAKDSELTGDIRTAMNVLRSHARPSRSTAKPKKRRR